jgi:hypothetical protein
MENNIDAKCIAWQKERGLDKLEFVMEEAIYRYLEEIFELRGFNSGDSKSFARDMTIEIEKLAHKNNIKYPKEDVIVDAICDLRVFGCGDLLKINYNPEKCMEETIKEISSRKGAWSPEKGKWIKDPDQDPDTLYEADYSKCKIS